MSDRTAEERAAEVRQIIKDISTDQADSARAHAYSDIASYAVTQIGNRLHERHEHAAAKAVRESWNRFVTVIQPLWMDDECDHPSHDEVTAPFVCYCGWREPDEPYSDSNSAEDSARRPD